MIVWTKKGWYHHIDSVAAMYEIYNQRVLKPNQTKVVRARVVKAKHLKSVDPRANLVKHQVRWANLLTKAVRAKHQKLVDQKANLVNQQVRLAKVKPQRVLLKVKVRLGKV